MSRGVAVGGAAKGPTKRVLFPARGCALGPWFRVLSDGRRHGGIGEKRVGPRHFLRRWPMVAALPLMCGCATTPLQVQLEAGELARLRERADITIVHYPTPPFSLRNPTAEARWSLLPIVGIVTASGTAQRAVEEGERIRVQYALEDPIARVIDRFLLGLRTELGLQNLRVVQGRFLSTDNIEELRRTFGPVIVLDFRTGWAASAVPKLIPFTAERYRVYYAVRSRLIRLEDARVLWQSLCSSVGRDPKASWALEELRERVNEAADVCTEQLLDHFARSCQEVCK